MSIAAAFTKAAGKRSRDDWEEVEDAEALKSFIEAKEAEIQKLRKENRELKKQIKGGAEGTAVEQSPEDLQRKAELLMKAIRKNIEGQMIYKNGMKRISLYFWVTNQNSKDNQGPADSGKRAAADFPGADLAVVKAMLGADICNKASNGAKQFTAKLDNEALYEMPGIGHSALTKSLRYGGTLQLTEGLKFVYNKAESQLRITGTFNMF